MSASRNLRKIREKNKQTLSFFFSLVHAAYMVFYLPIYSKMPYNRQFAMLILYSVVVKALYSRYLASKNRSGLYSIQKHSSDGVIARSSVRYLLQNIGLF